MSYYFSDSKSKRKQDRLFEAHRILIFCEGKRTEPEYFDGFIKDINKNAIYKDKIIIKTYGLGKNTVGVVKYAKEYVAKHKLSDASVWCVFDKDSFKSSDFDNAIKMCECYHYNCAWSNQCIEYWFILHFERYTSDNDRKNYIDFLNKRYKLIVNEKYQKNNSENYNILKTHGYPKKAIKFAKSILALNKGKTPSNSHPSTTVYLLVEELAKYLGDDIKSRYL